MKPLTLTLVLCACFTQLQAQWNTNGTYLYNTNSGGVGIGPGSAMSPRAPLEILVVGDNQSVQRGLILQQLNSGSPNNKAGVSLDFGIGNNHTNLNILGQIILKETSWSTQPKMTFNLWDPSNVMTERMVIDTHGKVGIGTSSPRSALEVMTYGNNDTVQSGLIIQQHNPGSPNNTAGVSLDFGVGNNGTNLVIQGKITLKETYWSVRPKMIFSLLDHTNTMKDRMVIDTDGNVGIGTATPDKALTVKGTIHTNEVLVDMNSPIQGPDYVFEENYNLLPLSEVEAYINANKHLPDVPSAKQMAEEGLNLKEMNLLLLKKVEELTLHLIEANKMIVEHNRMIAEQNKRISALEKD